MPSDISSVPPRKPLPITKEPDPTTASPKWYDWTYFSKRKRIIVIASVAIAVALIGLIVGLAVGLTKNRPSSHSNLPLPTNYGGPYKGELTYYDPALGACGITSTSGDLICAVSHVLFDAVAVGSNPNANPLCGLKIRVGREGSSVDVMIVDRCVGCAVNDLDVSSTVFERLADMDLGRVGMEWAWLEASPLLGKQVDR